jgi:hypothetical protein
MLEWSRICRTPSWGFRIAQVALRIWGAELPAILQRPPRCLSLKRKSCAGAAQRKIVADDRDGLLSTNLAGLACRSISASVRKRPIGQSLVIGPRLRVHRLRR